MAVKKAVLTAGWSVANSYTASGDTDILIVNTDAETRTTLRWIKLSGADVSGGLPVDFDVDDAIPLGGGQNKPMVLLDGESRAHAALRPARCYRFVRCKT